MPNFAPRRAGVTAWIFLAAFLIGLGWAAVNAFLSSPRLFALAVAVLLALIAIANFEVKRDRATLTALASERDGQSICEFARDFESRSIDTWVIRAVYEELQRQLTHVHPSFPVRADDRLKDDLRLDDDDLDMDVVHQVQTRTGRNLDYTSTNPYFGKVKTARDLVHFFHCQPRQGGAT